MSKTQTETKHRLLKISILRYNPQDPDSVPHMQTYELEEGDRMTLFIALNDLRDEQDPTLQFDFVCRAGICGSCAMLINGKPGLACRTLTRDLPSEFTLAPLPGFELIGDLSVNTGKWMRNMSERIESWVHTKEIDIDMRKTEVPMDPQLAEDLYNLDHCIECGCCVAACGTFRMRPDFVGAVAINKIARFRLDPRDDRNDADFYEVMGDDSGTLVTLSMTVKSSGNQASAKGSVQVRNLCEVTFDLASTAQTTSESVKTAPAAGASIVDLGAETLPIAG